MLEIFLKVNSSQGLNASFVSIRALSLITLWTLAFRFHQEIIHPTIDIEVTRLRVIRTVFS